MTSSELEARLGIPQTAPFRPDAQTLHYINLRLAALGLPQYGNVTEPSPEWREMAQVLLAHQRETDRLLADYLPPVDWRIQNWLDEYLYDTRTQVRLPHRTFVLYRHGIARTLSLPPDREEFRSEIVHSYRTRNGILNNPSNDRRTTQGVFHVAEGGLPIPNDKRSVKLSVFARMLAQALNPPEDLLELPFTHSQEAKARCFVSLLLRPTVVPAVPGRSPARSMEIRFFAPGNLVSNLDFVETIFGNAGDPFLPENDAGLDGDHWTGHTGCVILAPHLTRLRKIDVGLPRWDRATERERQDGMCWKTEDELYNDGSAFKLTARNERGVMVTLIADNYYGYCKKEVKTQISFAANLLGQAEEEHAGGALVFASYDLGEEFDASRHVQSRGHSYDSMIAKFADVMDPKPQGFAVDRRFADIFYVPEDARFDLHQQRVSWIRDDAPQSIRLLPGHTYVRPSGYKVHLERPEGRLWRLVGTRADATLCHKPCTVSGGGKSEISKSISDAILTGPVYVANFEDDCKRVAEILARPVSDRFVEASRPDPRPILDPDRSLGSVIKLLTPSTEYTPAFNEWLTAIPQYLKEFIFVIKRFCRPEWGGQWKQHFSVDVINGIPGNELKFRQRKLYTTHLRVGYQGDGSWRTFGLRKDFMPAIKVQYEDDITASVVVPSDWIQDLPTGFSAPSVKFVQNCEYRLFQRPDDAIHRGYDKQTESDFARNGNFFSNYQPLKSEVARDMIQNAIEFDQFTEPMKRFIKDVATRPEAEYFVCNTEPRRVGDKPSKNPRYLQTRLDLMDPRSAYLADISMRLLRGVTSQKPLPVPVTAVLPGRRNNPPEPGVRPLAVFNPIHYLELPELFMEFLCSMTGKSPSTTGAGSEGALTKGPFNALLPVVDVNNALLSYILCEHSAFITAAGYVGPHYRVDHDVSLLVPEIWCRMTLEEANPENLKKEGCLEPVPDIRFGNRVLPSSRLGWRITERFASRYCGRVFNHPHLVFSKEMLHPELQNLEIFADGMDNIVATHERIAASYFEDGSAELACPPLLALLHIMRDGTWQGHGLNDPAFRDLFRRDTILKSDWYRKRLAAQTSEDERLAATHVDALQKFMLRTQYAEEARRLGIPERLARARARLAEARSEGYIDQLTGTIGRQPVFQQESTGG